MFKQKLAIALSIITAFSSLAYAQDIEGVINSEATVIETVVESGILSEEKENLTSEPKTEEEIRLGSNTETESENITEYIEQTEEVVSEENYDIQILTEPVILMSTEQESAGNIITTDTYTDDMSNNDGKFECVNFSTYNTSYFDDTTIYGFTAVKQAAYVTYHVEGNRVFTAISATNYTRDGGKNAVIQYSVDGKIYTDVDSSAYKWTKVGKGGSGSNDGGWSDKNHIEVQFSAEEEIQYIRIYKEAETSKSKYKLGDITLTSVDLYAPKPEPEAPEGYGMEIDADSITDELDTTDYLFDNVNFKSYAEVSPGNAALFNDSSLLSFDETGKEAYLIYKAAEGRVFTNVKVFNYTRDGGTTAEIYVSSDGWTYTKLTSSWKVDGKGGSGSNDAGWSDLKSAENAIKTDNNIRFIKIRKSAETSRTKFKLGKINLTTADISKGSVMGDVYEEQFDEELYHVNSSKGITVVNNKFNAAPAAELVYKSMIKKALTKITVEVENDSAWSGIIEAMDVRGNKINKSIEIQKEVIDGNIVLTAELPVASAYVKIVNASACTYCAITVESTLAQGTEWTAVQKGNGSVFSLSSEGTEIGTLEDGCTVSFNIPIRNAGGIRQDVKAIICVFEGDMMEEMEAVDVAIGGGETVNAEGSIEIETVTENTHITLFVWSDISTMVPFGDEMYLDKN